ncbi:MAG: HYExAFE family protein [Planctomycetia bacterium]|nr:HYExAFE family protein [Planctomycetia bacterium]
MANRDNHYEAAFEAYLRQRQVPYVAVDESRRSLLGDSSLKSLDFIVSPSGDSRSGDSRGGGGLAEFDSYGCAAPPANQPTSWLVDVKGRLFPGGRQRQYWKNWSTRDDLHSLVRWEQLFGEQFGSLFVFAYRLVGDRAPLPREQLFDFRGRWYGFVGIRLCDYARHARPLSEAWGTVAMPTAQFRRLAAPLERFF